MIKVVNDVTVYEPSEAPERDTSETRGRKQLYPFDELQVGGCFEVPEGKLQSLRQLVAQRNKQHQDDPYYGKWSIGPATDGKYYVWRDQ